MMPSMAIRLALAACLLLGVLTRKAPGHVVARPASPVVQAADDGIVDRTDPPVWSLTETIPLDLDGIVGRLRILTPNPEVGLPIRISLELEDETPRDVPAPLWPLPGTLLGDFEVIGTDPSRNGDRWPSWSIRTFASGKVELPSFTIDWNGVESRTPPRLLDIASAAGIDTTPESFRDIADAVEISLPDRRPYLWIIGAIVLAVLALLAFRWWRRDPSSTAAPATPADVWALAQLDELAESDLLDRGRLHEFYLALTDITRVFIQRCYGIAAPDRTTPEAGRELERHPMVDPKHAKFLRNLLRAADMVKFAGDRPTVDEARRDLQMVRGFVLEASDAPSNPSAPAPAGTADEDSAASNSSRRPVHSARKRRQRAVDDAVDGLDQLEHRS